MKRIFLTCAALLFSSQALADECASASTQLEMNRCAAAQYQAADKKLNETYQSALKRLNETYQSALKRA
ncbi:Putative secreted protein [Salmonella enterica subsp. enterica serovar Give str. S5-487]|nr:Putative secreted protein [Salmonella enterica subsp. enterica serovar Give str. S5-487]